MLSSPRPSTPFALGRSNATGPISRNRSRPMYRSRGGSTSWGRERYPVPAPGPTGHSREEPAVPITEVNKLDSCYIRPIAFRGYGEMGVNPLAAPVEVSIAVWPWGAYLGEDALEQGARVKVSSWKRHDQNSLPSAAKATATYLGSILAKVEAVKGGYDEAILLNHA